MDIKNILIDKGLIIPIGILLFILWRYKIVDEDDQRWIRIGCLIPIIIIGMGFVAEYNEKYALGLILLIIAVFVFKLFKQPKLLKMKKIFIKVVIPISVYNFFFFSIREYALDNYFLDPTSWFFTSLVIIVICIGTFLMSQLWGNYIGEKVFPSGSLGEELGVLFVSFLMYMLSVIFIVFIYTTIYLLLFAEFVGYGW